MKKEYQQPLIDKKKSKTVFMEYSELKAVFLDNHEANLLFVEDFFNNCVFYVLPSGIRIKSNSQEDLLEAAHYLREIIKLHRQGESITVSLLANMAHKTEFASADTKSANGCLNGVISETAGMVFYFDKRSFVPKTEVQKEYIQKIFDNDVVFCTGPAGTGKTYIAAAVALYFLKIRKVEKVIMVRPAVEAGESLGFLPGDLEEKLEPYLCPLFDALSDITGTKEVEKLKEEGFLQVIPLAYMRGRTLNNSFVILDEGQNATKAQMKMFLTRLGNGSKAVVTGDITQIDLPAKDHSGLVEACKILKGISGVEFHQFSKNDVKRHPIVQEIINAYEKNL